MQAEWFALASDLRRLYNLQHSEMGVQCGMLDVEFWLTWGSNFKNSSAGRPILLCHEFCMYYHR